MNSTVSTYYKSPEGKAEILRQYSNKLDKLGLQYESHYYETTYGSTHVISCGPEHAPPMILVHGSNGCAPIALETYAGLISEFRVYAVDVLSQPNRSAETRLSMKDTSYGAWMHELLDKMGLEEVRMAGFSLGGLVILKTLEFSEKRIKAVYLSAPAYIVNGAPLKALFKVFIPMRKYMRTKDKQYLERFLNAVFSERDDFAFDFLAEVFLGFKMDFSQVPTISTKSAQAIKTPITLFAADDDILFPGAKMLKRAKKIFPSLREVQLLNGSKHVQTAKDNRRIERYILKDLEH